MVNFMGSRLPDSPLRLSAARAGCPAPAGVVKLERELRVELHDPGAEDARRRAPRRAERVVPREHRPIVENVVEVQGRPQTRGAEAHQLRDPEVELTDTVLALG